MRKDDALHEAKKSYMQNSNSRNKLPYYWANMILAGNGEPVKLNRVQNINFWVAGFVLLIVSGYLLLQSRKNSKTIKATR